MRKKITNPSWKWAGRRAFLLPRCPSILLKTDICLPPACFSQCLPTGQECFCLYQPSSPIAPTSLPSSAGNFTGTTMSAPWEHQRKYSPFKMARTLKLTPWFPTLQKYQVHPAPSRGLSLFSSAFSIALLNYRPVCQHHRRPPALVPRVLLERTTFPTDGRWPPPYSSLPRRSSLTLSASPSSPRMPPWHFFTSYPRTLRIPQSWALKSLLLPPTLTLLEGCWSIQKHLTLCWNPSFSLSDISALRWPHP